MNNILPPKNHPRYMSLLVRHKLIEGYENGVVSQAGLIAHGRGEAFDYILGEKTHAFARRAEKVSVASMLSAEKPIISVNGNTAALVLREIIELADLTHAKIEVNLFYFSRKREANIIELLAKNGGNVITRGKKTHIPGIEHNRGIVYEKGIFSSDCVLVPLEDGDRTHALVDMKKRVIAIDLNPLSRTSQTANITIVNNIIRAVPDMIGYAKKMKNMEKEDLIDMVNNFDNKKNLNDAIDAIRKYLSQTAESMQM